MAEMGGFGRFQKLSTVAMSFMRTGGLYMYYAFAYLTLEQMYECRSDKDQPFASCSAKNDICPQLEKGDKQIEYRVDTSYEYYLDNWFVQMDLVCSNKVQTNAMISALYVAFGVAGVLFFSTPDRFGRRPVMLANYGIHMLAQYLMIFVPTYNARLTGFVLYGLCQLKCTVCYVWMAELVPQTNANSVAVTLTSLDSGTIAVVCLYWMLVSRNWFPLVFVMTLLGSLAFLFAVCFMPESPSWLLIQGRQAEAI